MTMDLFLYDKYLVGENGKLKVKKETPKEIKNELIRLNNMYVEIYSLDILKF